MKKTLSALLVLGISISLVLLPVMPHGKFFYSLKRHSDTYVGSCYASDTPPFGDYYDIYVTTGTNTIVQAFDETDQKLYTASGYTYTSHSGLVFAENCDVYNTNGTVRAYINNQVLASD